MNLKYPIFSLIFLTVLASFAQNKQVLYDFNEVPQALLLNPGLETSYDWYAGIPMLSGISVQAGTSGISVDDIFADDGLDINDKVLWKLSMTGRRTCHIRPGNPGQSELYQSDRGLQRGVPRKEQAPGFLFLRDVWGTGPYQLLAKGPRHPRV